MNFLLLASFVAVFLKAWQQKCVIGEHYWVIPLGSFGMAISEVFIVVGIVEYGISWNTVINLAIGGTLGCWCAMYTHGRMFK